MWPGSLSIQEWCLLGNVPMTREIILCGDKRHDISFVSDLFEINHSFMCRKHSS